MLNKTLELDRQAKVDMSSSLPSLTRVKHFPKSYDYHFLTYYCVGLHFMTCITKM